MTKTCSKCKEAKELTEFGKNTGRTKDNLTCWCKICNSKFASDWRKNNPLKYKATKLKYKTNNPHQFWADKTLRDHKNCGNIINITFDELCNKSQNVLYCELCRIKLEWDHTKKKGRSQFNSPSLDRKNNENIINEDNIMIICHKCNVTKQDRTLIEFIQYCKNISEKFEGIS